MNAYRLSYSVGKVSAEFVELDGARVVRVHDLEEGVDVFSFHGDSELGDQVVYFVDC